MIFSGLRSLAGSFGGWSPYLLPESANQPTLWELASYRICWYQDVTFLMSFFLKFQKEEDCFLSTKTTQKGHKLQINLWISFGFWVGFKIVDFQITAGRVKDLKGLWNSIPSKVIQKFYSFFLWETPPVLSFCVRDKLRKTRWKLLDRLPSDRRWVDEFESGLDWFGSSRKTALREGSTGWV